MNANLMALMSAARHISHRPRRKSHVPKVGLKVADLGKCHACLLPLPSAGALQRRIRQPLQLVDVAAELVAAPALGILLVRLLHRAVAAPPLTVRTLNGPEGHCLDCKRLRAAVAQVLDVALAGGVGWGVQHQTLLRCNTLQ